jgi:hypothetical protein
LTAAETWCVFSKKLQPYQWGQEKLLNMLSVLVAEGYSEGAEKVLLFKNSDLIFPPEGICCTNLLNSETNF